MKGRRTSTAVFVTICLLMSLVAGAGQALAAAGSPPTASDVATARTDYIKSLEPANGGKANAHAADLVIGGMKIPADVAATKSFAQGKLHVLVTVPGNALAKVSASRSESLATMTQGEAAPAIAAIRAAQDESIARVMAAGVQLTGIMRFSVLFNGYAAQIAVSDLGKLAEVVGRANVHFSRLAQIDDTTSNAQIGADAVRVDPGVDGTGACVGVVDTGVDYTHPDFGGDGTNHGFPTSKIVAGYDFAGDNGDAITNDDRSLIVPDPDPMDTNEHGTHVSGIVAADGKVTGVAPKAKIVIAKISPGSIGSAYSEEIMAAWEYMADPNNLDGGPEGTHPPVQSVNMSFGSVAGFDDPTDPERIAIENAIASGIVASLSAGNSASHYTSPFNYNFYPDYSTLGSPATTPAAISVASSENSIIAGWGVTEATSDADYVYFTGSTSPDPVVSLGSNNGAGYAYAWCGLGRDPGDGPYPDDFAGVDLVGKIALMSRGTTSFYQKINNAAERGAVGAIIANNQPGTISMNTSGSTLTSVSITQADGAALKLKAAAPVGDGTGRLMFLGHYASTSNPAVNTISSFSSWGATPNLAFKPEVTAPGGNIWSTVPVAQGSYANLSGTSMAAPHVAAAAALIRLVHPEWTVEQVKTALMNTGVLLTDPASTAHLPYSPRLQGAGRINVYNAVHNDVTVTSQLNGQAAVALGSVESWKSDPITFPLVLRNAGASPVTYNVTGTVQWVNAGGAAKASAIPGATFAASPSSVTVGPGEARTVVVSVNATGVRLSYNYFPYVEGFVTFTPAAGGVTLHVPYMGYLGNWNDFDDATWAPTFNPLVDLPYAYNSYSANFYGGDVGETGVTWPEDPTNGWAQMGKTIMGTFDATTIAINPTRATTGPNGGIENNIYVLRNIANLKVEVRDVANNLVKRLDNVDWVWRGDYASYGNDYSWYWSGNAPWQWYGTDTAGHMVPDGQYYLNTVATAEKVVNKPGYDAPQTVSFPVFVDTQVPVTVVTGAAPDGTGHTVLTWTVNDPAPSSGLWGIYLAWSSDNWATLSSTWLAPTVRTAAVPQGAAYALYTIDNAGNVAQASAAAGSIAITSPAGLASVDGLSFEVSGTFSTATTGSFELVVGTGAGEQVTYPFSVRNAVTFGPLEVSAVAFASLTGGGTCETT
ncbi:MAG TPA: S8 family serine peptidase, partial [Candidatus Cryosericum sp.]|nr:S8 family serine peptidase [Candidatus Cryosericum sp.]